MACCQMLISTCASACLPGLGLSGLPAAAGAVLAVLTLGAMIEALQALLSHGDVFAGANAGLARDDGST